MNESESYENILFFYNHIHDYHYSLVGRRLLSLPNVLCWMYKVWQK